MTLIKRIRYLLTPHRENNQRARTIHPSALLLYILLFIFLQQSLEILHKFKPAILGYATDIRVDELLKITNQKREENGLPPLTLNEKLSKAAYNKALDMFNKNYWSHSAPDGTSPWKFIVEQGYTYLVAGENLAKNFANSREVVEAWMASPSHRDNIIKRDYQDIGFAIVDGKLQGEETTLVVQMFGRQKSVSIAEVKNQTINIIPTPQPTTTPIITPILEESTIEGGKTSIIPYEIAAIKRRPVFDIFLLKRQISLFMLLFLTAVFFIDGYFVYAHRKVRIAGRNWAHIIFLLSIFGIIYFASRGTIL